MIAPRRRPRQILVPANLCGLARAATIAGSRNWGGDTSPYAAPARAIDLSGLPRTFIAVGALDLFVDECLDYAHRLIRTGVPTELHVYPGCVHGFGMARDSGPAQRAQADNLAAFRAAFAPVRS